MHAGNGFGACLLSLHNLSLILCMLTVTEHFCRTFCQVNFTTPEGLGVPSFCLEVLTERLSRAPVAFLCINTERLSIVGHNL